MSEPIVIWGAGAIGGTVGAFLLRAGHPVILVDVVPEHVAAIKDGRLTIEGPIATFSTGGPAFLPQDVKGTYPLMILAVKSYHTAAAMQEIMPHLSADGTVVSFQNGLNELEIAKVVGRARTIGAFVNFSADYLGPGQITYGARSPLRLGELDGKITPRLEALQNVIADFEEDCAVTDDIFSYLWGKSSYATFQSSSALTNETMPDFMADPAMQSMLFELIREVLAVAAAEGVRARGFQGYEPDAFVSGDPAAMRASLMANREFKMRSTKKHSGYWRDLAVRKRPTDIAAQLAPVQELGRKHGMGTPRVDFLLAQIGKIERGEREIGTPLAAELAAYVRTLPPVEMPVAIGATS